jgi:hypothetical protein
MNSNIKIFFVVIIFFVINISLFAQKKINCENIEFSKKDYLLDIIDKYLDGDPEKIIVLVDYLSKDSIDIFRLNGSMEPFELFYKKPDCFFHYRNNVVYLFTENYKNKKDTVWLNHVLQETINLYGFSEATINWAKDSIVSVNGHWILCCDYDPWIIEYKIYNGEIIEQNFCTEMLYPPTGNPKGIFSTTDMIIIEVQEYQKEYYYKRNYGGSYFGW